jgi:hypothetical protein
VILLLDLGPGGEVVFMLGDFPQNKEVIQPPLEFFEREDSVLEVVDGVDRLARTVLVVPELRAGQLVFQRLEVGFQLRDVKDTSGVRRGGP